MRVCRTLGLTSKHNFAGGNSRRRVLAEGRRASERDRDGAEGGGAGTGGDPKSSDFSNGTLGIFKYIVIL